LSLRGGLGPPLDSGSLAGKPEVYLEAIILRGRPGTAMPAWQGLLDQQDARWIARALKEGFPDER
jgi:cytochrome c55X